MRHYPSVSQQYLTVEEGDILSPMLPMLHIIGDQMGIIQF